MDFAIEFISNGSIVSFAGYSIFSTDKHNSFGGSYVASESQLAAKLPDLTKMINALEEILPSILMGYSGYFGIDMMLLEDNTIHPCVELNLRNTMGVVAMVLGNRYLCNASHGCFNVTFHKSEENISRWIADYSNRFPLVINNGRISSGFLSLCPVSKETRYSCTLLVEKNCK